MAATVARPVTAVPPREASVQGALREAGELTRFGGQSLAALPGSLQYVSEALRQASMMLRGTIPLLTAMQVFQGAVVSIFAFFLLRGIGAGDYFGLITGIIGPRQVACTMFGYVFTAKICCGIAAELGAMKIQQEVDPRRYLVGTRVLGVLLFTPVAAIVSVLATALGSYLVVVTLLHGLSGATLMSVHWSIQSLFDTQYVIVDCLCIAVPTAIAACFYGLRTSGGPAAVGGSVARSMVVNLVIVHIVAAFGAVMAFGFNNRLPIGG
jgi:phospholipid/cholesterol/gamma-HCH transport system permease protein